MRRPSPNKGMCRKTKSKRNGHTQVPQLQGRPLYGQCQMSIPQGNDSEKDTSTSSSSSTTFQIRMVNQPYSTQTVNIHSTQAHVEQVSTVTTAPDIGRLSRHSNDLRENSGSYTRGYFHQIASAHAGTSVTQNTPSIPASHSAKETIPLRGMETSREESSQQTTTRSNSTGATSRQLSPRPGTSTVNQSSNVHSKETSYTHQNRTSGVPNDCQGHSSNEQTDHVNATTVDVPDGRHPTKSVHSQHSKGHITEYAGHNAKIRIMHWNCQGLNNQGKRSALMAAIQLDQIDVAMVQDSRISDNNDDKPPIRVPNYHTYYIPASAESHGLITICQK